MCSVIEGSTHDPELGALSAMESDSLPSEHGMKFYTTSGFELSPSPCTSD